MAQPQEVQVMYWGQYKDDTQRIAVSATPTPATPVQPGLYYAFCDVDCRIKQGNSSVAVDATHGIPIPAKTYFPPSGRFYFSGDNDGDTHIAAVGSAGGTLELIRVAP